MDVNSVRSQRGNRETSPDRAKICRLKHKVKPSRKVQVVYYLSRNGLLEHPHFMEVTLLPNQPLRLKGTRIYQHKKGKLSRQLFFFIFLHYHNFLRSFACLRLILQRCLRSAHGSPWEWHAFAICMV